MNLVLSKQYYLVILRYILIVIKIGSYILKLIECPVFEIYRK